MIGEGPLTFEKLGKLEYCTAVINESLRMFPPAQGPYVHGWAYMYPIAF